MSITKSYCSRKQVERPQVVPKELPVLFGPVLSLLSVGLTPLSSRWVHLPAKLAEGASTMWTWECDTGVYPQWRRNVLSEGEYCSWSDHYPVKISLTLQGLMGFLCSRAAESCIRPWSLRLIKLNQNCIRQFKTMLILSISSHSNLWIMWPALQI